jgi:carbamoyltransferase
MANDPWILGMSCSHNGSVCLLHGDEIVVAIQEERLSRIKRHSVYGSQSSMALEHCFNYAGIQPKDLSLVVYCVQGRVRNLEQDITMNPYLRVTSNRIPTLALPHHFCHAVSAFATSGFKDSAVLVIDGIGSPYEDLLEDERGVVLGEGSEVISLYSASKTTITPIEKHLTTGWLKINPTGMDRFGSLGGMFEAVAQQIFGDRSEAGKVMGLAPYGQPEIPIHEFFDILDGRFTFPDNVPKMFEHNDRWPLRKAEYQNLSASTQVALENALLYLIDHLRQLCPGENLCYSGGVALNSVANERVIAKSAFKNVYIMPAAEDSGIAIGAAYYGLWQLTRNNTRRKLIHDAMGSQYSSSAIMDAINRAPAIELVDTEDFISHAADLLCEGKIIGWFQGRSELGPRALGQRSILCDARREDGKDNLNGRVKFREAFRPFAPAILLEEVDEWFELKGTYADSPFMLRVCDFKKDKMDKVPAVVHVDGTGRIQTVTRQGNGPFYDLISRFFEKTGVPIILNTSFNTMGEPIVETPEDALFCLLTTGIDYCVLEDKIVTKRQSFPSESSTKLLSKIREIKRHVNEMNQMKEPIDIEMMIDRALEKIHLATVQALLDFEEEIHRYLGCTLPDFKAETFENFRGDTLSIRGWQSLDKATRACMITAGLAHSLLTRYPHREKDWTAVQVVVLKAIEIELNIRLIAPFGSWLANHRVIEVDDLISSAGPKMQAPWLRFLETVRGKNKKPDDMRLPIGSICWAFSKANGSTHHNQALDVQPYQQSLLKLLEQYGSDSQSPGLEKLLKSIGELMETISIARRECLSTESLGRYKTIDLIEKVQWLVSWMAQV